MDNNSSQQIEDMKKELDRYKSGDESTLKDLLQAMKESSAWLTEQLKK